MAKYTLEYSKSARAKCRRWVALARGAGAGVLPGRWSQIHATEHIVLKQLTDARRLLSVHLSARTSSLPLCICDSVRLRRCQDTIPEGALRTGETTDVFGHESVGYRHWGCSTKEILRTINLQTPGFHELRCDYVASARGPRHPRHAELSSPLRRVSSPFPSFPFPSFLSFPSFLPHYPPSVSSPPSFLLSFSLINSPHTERRISDASLWQ